MALLGSNPHKTWVFEQCHVALFVEIALLLYFKLLKQTPSESRFLRFELCHFPLNCATWHCSQTRINTGFFANSAKFSSQAEGALLAKGGQEDGHGPRYRGKGSAVLE